MSLDVMLIELAEKMGLLAAAALVAVLYPPLRKRLLGGGQRSDKLAAALFGLALSIWGANLGFRFANEHFNVRAIGVLIAAILGGWKAGLIAGVGGGVFYATQVDEETAPWVLVASILDGVLAGIVAERRPEWVRDPPRVFAMAVGIQAVHIVVVGVGLVLAGTTARYLPAWPAHVVKLLVNAAGVTLFVAVARVVVSRERAAVELVEARAAAEHATLESLRRRLEPHFLFNALTAVRATIRKDPERARELVADLADLYRYLLSHPDDAPLRAEVAHAQAYLAIERARLGEERVKLEVDLPESLAALRVPALSLQPLVENAIRHGVARHEGAGVIRIRVRDDSGVLVVTVEDHTEGASLPETEVGAKIALATLRERLARRFGEAASLALAIEDDGAIATLRLPIAALGTVDPGMQSDVPRVAAPSEERAA